MDLHPSEDENEAPLLTDSGTESINESPLAEEESEESTVCDYKCENSNNLQRIKLHPSLIDKSFSIDEDDLCTPLEPTPVGVFQVTPIASSSNDTSEASTPDRSDEDDGIVEEDFINVEFHNNGIQDDINSTGDTLSNKRSYNGFKEKKIPNAGGDNELVPIPEVANEQEIDEINLEEDETVIPANDKTNLLPSILRRPSFVENNQSKHRVCFPNDEDELVSYRVPEDDYPWIISDNIPAEEILQVYISSCKKHGTVELDSIKEQIQEIKNNTNHTATLRLSSIKITSDVNETMEDLLKVTNFHSLVLSECKFTPETMSEFLNMLEYYGSVCNIEIAMNFEDDDTWKCFCNACSNIMVLESLSFKGMNINETYMRNLLSAVRNNSNITILKFDGCTLVKLPTFYLIENLMKNETIRELYLPSTRLYTKEADALQKFLSLNTHLKVLDISNNFLGDRGLEVLARGLCKQTCPGFGLSVLVIFNNQLTEKSGPVIGNIILECKNLHTLNIGYNNLTDEVLKNIAEALPKTESLEGLGLQCTLLTCKGMIDLGEAIQNNKSLQKINLKGNKAIQINGIETLCNALTNSKINKVEIDETNRSCNDPESYSQLIKKLNGICTINKTYVESNEEDDEVTNISQQISRKVSLSCEPKYTVPEPQSSFYIGSPISSPIQTPSSSPSPIPSPGPSPSASPSPVPSPSPSPSPKNRFKIVKVNEPYVPKSTPPPSSSRMKVSRFYVTKVPPSPDDDVSLGRFANVRSSVSSNESVDSLTQMHLDSDSE